MKKRIKRILSSVLVAVMLVTSIPSAVYAADASADNPEKLELSDEYIKVTVSGENGGFLIDTLEGDKLEKADNNKFLLYPAEDYDTSYTSIRVTRKNGDVEDYIFGRKYGFLWLEGREVNLVKEGNSIVASWSVKDITVEQSLPLLDEMASQHGMVGISYKVSTTSDDVENVKLRIMLDTALGYQDFGTYQVPNSLNEYTTVIGEDGIPFEVQIRTYDMHAIAEYGVAAHWKYKQGGQGEGDEKGYEWIRRLLESQEDADAEDFIHNLKVDMFSDEVFVFTPRGDVINLPAGATPIDFAYSIHSAIGNSMVGAKVNGRIVGFDNVLHNGDIVEINTSKSAHGPSRDWVKIARSSEARSKIRQWFKKERREENIAHGRASFESELKHAGLSMALFTAPDVLPVIMQRIPFNTLDEMYAAIGYGGFTAVKAVNRVKDELIRMDKIAKVAEYHAAKDSAKVQPKKTKSEKGIVVEGLSNCLVKFSRCCSPVPGDEIVGFITRGYGVSVHRKDCPNAVRARSNNADQGRWINVSWGDEINETYSTSLEVISKDRPNLLIEISTALSTCQVSVSSMSANATADGFAIFQITLSVKDSHHLDQVMRKIHQISGVMKVNRPAG